MKQETRNKIMKVIWYGGFASLTVGTIVYTVVLAATKNEALGAGLAACAGAAAGHWLVKNT